MSCVRSFAADPTSVGAARRFATERLADLPADTRGAVELMVSELATNCVRHAEASFEVRVAREGRRVLVEVTDDAPGTPVRRSPGPEDPRGRGLQIVELFSDAWGVKQRPTDGKTVWFAVAAALAA
jgi:two-component sensor histidine kinase